MAISHAKDDTIYIFGRGVYDGDFEPPNGPMGVSREEWDKLCMEVNGKTQPFPSNPRIKLDSGKIVWGQECWWGPEEVVNKKLALYATVVDVDIDQAREEAAKG